MQKYPNKIIAIQIQGHVKKSIYHNQVAFMLGIQS